MKVLLSVNELLLRHDILPKCLRLGVVSKLYHLVNYTKMSEERVRVASSNECLKSDEMFIEIPNKVQYEIEQVKPEMSEK